MSDDVIENLWKAFEIQILSRRKEVSAPEFGFYFYAVDINFVYGYVIGKGFSGKESIRLAHELIQKFYDWRRKYMEDMADSA